MVSRKPWFMGTRCGRELLTVSALSKVASGCHGCEKELNAPALGSALPRRLPVGAGKGGSRRARSLTKDSAKWEFLGALFCICPRSLQRSLPQRLLFGHKPIPRARCE